MLSARSYRRFRGVHCLCHQGVEFAALFTSSLLRLKKGDELKRRQYVAKFCESRCGMERIIEQRCDTGYVRIAVADVPDMVDHRSDLFQWKCKKLSTIRPSWHSGYTLAVYVTLYRERERESIEDETRI
jgi:hypothetical protein